MQTERSSVSIEGLWHDLHSELLAFARPRLGSDAEAEDVLQVAFLRAHQQVESGTSPDNARAWLYQIVRNLAIDTHRKHARRREVAEPDLHVDLEAVEDERSAADIDDDETRAVLARALPLFIEQLASPYREALHLVDIEGLTQVEAAARVGLSVSGMKSRVQRARKQLLALLQACCDFGLDARNRVIACYEPESNEVCDLSDPCRS